jgi:hypothetical protein
MSSKALSGPPNPASASAMIGALERLVDPLHHRGNRVRGIEALIGIDLTRQIGIRRHLPAREINGLQTRAHHLHRLIARERAKAGDIRASVQEFPERVLDPNGAAEPGDILGAVIAPDALEAAGCLRFRGRTLVERAHGVSLGCSLRRNIGGITPICTLVLPKKSWKSVHL